MGEIKPDRFYEALEVQNGRLLAEVERLQADRDELLRLLELAAMRYHPEGDRRIYGEIMVRLESARPPATSSPSASGRS
jgi:hypothetical protein